MMGKHKRALINHPEYSFPVSFPLYLRNEFDFWKVHGIMNTSGLLQS